GASTSLSRCWRAGLRRAERSSRALRKLLECWVQPSLSSPSTSVRTGCSNTSTPRLRRRSAGRGSACHRQWTRDLTICRSGVPARGKHRESSVPPKVFEAVGCHVGVPNGVLDVLVPESKKASGGAVGNRRDHPASIGGSPHGSRRPPTGFAGAH